jgi:hypothetical protein
VAASKGSLDDIVAASEFISDGDLFQKRLMRTQDWSLLPHIVQTTVAAARTVSGPAPFQIFPQLLGKNSRRMKHTRIMEEMSRHQRCSSVSLRLDRAEYMNHILLIPLNIEKPDIKGAIQRMKEMSVTRDELMESVDILFSPVELTTKVKTALTREYNKTVVSVKKKVIDSESDDEVNELEEIE